MTKKLFVLAIVVIAGLIATSAWSQNPAETKDKPASSTPPQAEKSVFTAKDSASTKTFPTSSQTYATASPSSASERKELVIERALVTLIEDNKVPASEPGMLMKVEIKEGNSVDRDQILAEIDTRATVAKQRIAKAEHDAAVKQAENNAELEVAEKAIEVAKADLDANHEIRKKNPGAVSESEHRKYVFQHEKALAQKKQAYNEKEIAGLTAIAKQAQFDAASIELDLRQIRAPFKGQIVELMKNVGDWVTAGEPIMHIVGLDKVRVRGYVLVGGADGASHDEVIGKPVTITVDSPGGKKHTVKGIIGFASPVIEGFGSDRQFKIWSEVDNERSVDPVTGQESWKIQPGSMATMSIDLRPTRAALKPVTSAEKSDSKTTKSTARER